MFTDFGVYEKKRNYIETEKYLIDFSEVESLGSFVIGSAISFHKPFNKLLAPELGIALGQTEFNVGSETIAEADMLSGIIGLRIYFIESLFIRSYYSLKWLSFTEIKGQDKVVSINRNLNMYQHEINLSLGYQI